MPPTEVTTKTEDQTFETVPSQEKPKKQRKTKTETEKKPKKEKKTKNIETSSKTNPVIDNINNNEQLEDEDNEDDEEEVDVSRIIIDDKEYFIDNNKNIYDNESHEIIGTYDNNSLVLN